MANIVACKACAGTISDAAPSCPHCGHRLSLQPPLPAQAPTKSRRVAALYGIFLGLVILVYLTTSGSPKESKLSPNTEKPRNPAPAMPFAKEQLIEELEAKLTDGNLLKEGKIKAIAFQLDEVTIEYSRTSQYPAMTPVEAEVTTTGLVKLSIDILIAHGLNPRSHRTILFGHAYQPAGKSVTGADRVRTFGYAIYDYNEDRIKFKPVDE